MSVEQEQDPFRNAATQVGHVPLFAEADCYVTAGVSTVNPGRGWVAFGPVTLHGTLGTLDRLAREMTAAVDALRPPVNPCDRDVLLRPVPTLNEFVLGCVADVIEGR